MSHQNQLYPQGCTRTNPPIPLPFSDVDPLQAFTGASNSNSTAYRPTPTSASTSTSTSTSTPTPSTNLSSTHKKSVEITLEDVDALIPNENKAATRQHRQRRAKPKVDYDSDDELEALLRQHAQELLRTTFRLIGIRLAHVVFFSIGKAFGFEFRSVPGPFEKPARQRPQQHRRVGEGDAEHDENRQRH